MHTSIRLRRRQSGFIITIELLLLTTILIIGSLAGLVAIRDALIKHRMAKTSHEITIYDATGKALGEVVSFDEHETPLIPYVDRSVPPLAPDPAHRNFRALIGVRDDRFTSREPIYYSEADCSGTPCIKTTSDEAADNTGLSGLPATGAVSYLHALQGGPNYAIGASPDGIQGYLYRSTNLACPVAAADIKSRYLSQKVVTGSPCENRTVTTAPTDSGSCDPALGSCVTQTVVSTVDCGEGTSQQSILQTLEGAVLSQVNAYLAQLGSISNPSGNYTKFLGDVLVTSALTFDVCCPAGSTLREDGAVLTAAYLTMADALQAAGLPSGQLKFLLEDLGAQKPDSEFSCLTGAATTPGSGTASSTDWGNLQTRTAEAVPHPDDPLRNALDGFVTPFQASLPADLAAGSWISTPPDGE